MALITSNASGNWGTGATWVGGVKPGTGDTVAIAAGHTITLNEDTAVLGAAGIINVSGSNTSVLDISGTRVINGNVSYSGTATTGFITLTTGGQVTINGTLTASAAGYAMVVTGSGVYHVTNVGGTALSNTSTGRCISSVSTGTCTVTGACINSTMSGATSYCVYHTTGVGNLVITGSVSSTGYGPVVFHSAGSLTIVGKITTSRIATTVGTVIVSTASTFTWTGNYSYISELAVIVNFGAPMLILGTISSPLVITNTDSVVCMLSRAGTVNTTYFTHVRTTAASQFAFVGSSAFTDTGPTLPAAADVQAGAADYGYAGALLDPAYPTTAVSQAAQLATDQAAVTAGKADILSTRTILAIAGTFNLAANDVGVAAAQKATDAAFLETHKDEILVDANNILAEFGVTGTFDYPTAAEIAAAMWSDATSPVRRLTA